MSPMATVGGWSIAFLFVSALICFGVPVGLAIWGKVKYKKAFSFLPLLWGVVGFIVSQLVFRTYMLQGYNFGIITIPGFLPRFEWYQRLALNPWLFSLFLALTAGLVEEFARFIVFAIMKKKRRFTDGLSYGIGHGGIEAMLLVGLSFVNLIIYVFIINAGGWNAIVSSLPADIQAQYVQLGKTLTEAPPADFLPGGLERLFAITIQIAFSLLVAKGFMVNRKWRYLCVAILLHALVDFPAGLYQLKILNIGAWAMEGIVFVFAAAAAAYIVLQAKQWRRQQAPEIPANV